MKLSPDQQLAVDNIFKAFQSGAKQVTLRGLAGTGKTTCVEEIVRRLRQLRGEIQVLAPTGKAASVLKNKFECGAKTIHSFAYSFRGTKEDPATGEEIPLFDEDWFESGLLVVDESSMVGKTIYRHLISADIPILWVGDHGQLPPVKDDDPGIVSNPQHPCFTLETIHRQDGDSGIIDLAYSVRNGNHLLDGIDRPNIEVVQPKSITDMVDKSIEMGVDQFITYTNKNRERINDAHRRVLGYNLLPADKAKLVCLRNNYQFQMWNGEVWGVDGPVKHNEMQNHFVASLKSDDLIRKLVVMTPDRKYREWDKVIVDWGWCLTVHKSQGSEWGHVAIFHHGLFGDAEKMLYTAVTRAAEKLTIFHV